MAEGVGFEPTVTCATTVFETANVAFGTPTADGRPRLAGGTVTDHDQRRTGVMLLAAAGVAMAVGMIVLIIGFVSSSLVPIYVSIGLTVGAALLALAGTVLLIPSFARPHPA